MLKNILLLFLVSVFLTIPIFAQTPCVNGMAGEYPCNDYDLMSRVPISTLASTLGNEEGSDIWGWTDPLTNKEYAIVGTTNSTAFVDITNPTSPIFLGRIDTENGNTSFWRDVKVYNNYAFIVADNIGNHGIQIFDLTNLRSGPNPDLTYTSAAGDGNVTNFAGNNGITIGSCHNIVINEAEGFAYLVGCAGAANGGPIFVDINDPLNPSVSGSYSDKGYTHDAQVITYNGPDTAYTGHQILMASNGATGGGTDKVVVLDVTNKNAPVFISEITYPQAGYAHQGWFTEDHVHFILGDELDESGFGINTTTFIFNMTDLDNPVLSSTYVAAFDAIDHNGYVKGNEFYLANYRAGMRVLDITNINAATNAMSEIGFFDTYPASNNTNFNGAWSIYPYFASGNIIISDIERGLFVVRKSNTLNVKTFAIKNSFSISPNPTTDFATIKSNTNAKITSVQIYSILGQKVFNKHNISDSQFVLPINTYAKGVYLIKINNTITKKLVIK